MPSELLNDDFSESNNDELDMNAPAVDAVIETDSFIDNLFQISSIVVSTVTDIIPTTTTATEVKSAY